MLEIPNLLLKLSVKSKLSKKVKKSQIKGIVWNGRRTKTFVLIKERYVHFALFSLYVIQFASSSISFDLLGQKYECDTGHILYLSKLSEIKAKIVMRKNIGLPLKHKK